MRINTQREDEHLGRKQSICISIHLRDGGERGLPKDKDHPQPLPSPLASPPHTPEPQNQEFQVWDNFNQGAVRGGHCGLRNIYSLCFFFCLFILYRDKCYSSRVHWTVLTELPTVEAGCVLAHKSLFVLAQTLFCNIAEIHHLYVNSTHIFSMPTCA